jgi:hypothetical protein
LAVACVDRVFEAVVIDGGVDGGGANVGVIRELADEADRRATVVSAQVAIADAECPSQTTYASDLSQRSFGPPRTRPGGPAGPYGGGALPV